MLRFEIFLAVRNLRKVMSKGRTTRRQALIPDCNHIEFQSVFKQAVIFGNPFAAVNVRLTLQNVSTSGELQ